MLATLKEVSESEEVTEGGGLLGGITSWHLRMLIENPFEGGGGYTLEEVGRMTPDQIYSRLCDKDALKREVGDRTEKMLPLDTVSVVKPDSDGFVKGRAVDGTEIRGRIGGKSVARKLMEKANTKKGR